MSAYNPPIEDLPIFDTNAFTNANTGNGALVSEYLKFPIAQGKETFPQGLVGNLTGNASTASLATQVTVVALTNDTICYPTFVVGTGSRGIAIDNTVSADYTYNPSTNTLVARNIISTSLTSLATQDIRIATNTGTNKINFNNTGTTGNICYMDSTGLTMATGKKITTPTMLVSDNLQNSYLSAIVNGGAFFIDGDTAGGDIVITTKTSGSKTIIRTEGAGGVLTDCATFENGGITGNLNGNASSVTITSDDGSGSYYIPFTKTSGTGSRTLFMDDTLPALTYTPNTNLLTVRNIDTTNLIAITDFDMTIATTTTTKKIYFNNTGTTGNICYMDSGGIQMASGKYLTGFVIGDVTGVSSKLLLTTSSSNIEYNVPFTSAVAGGGGDFYIDSSLNITYNPSTNNLTLPNMIVSNNLQNSYLSAIVGGGTFYIDGDTAGGDIVITAKTSGSKTIIQTEGVGGALTNCATFENGGITGNLNGTSKSITITSDNNTGTFYIPFTKTSGTGSKELFMDDVTGPLTYNPSTGLLTTTVSAVNVVNLTTDANYYPTFVTGTGSRAIAIDNTTNSDYRYNPSTNTLTARNILGNTLYSLTTTDLNIATSTITNKINFNGTSGTNNICYMDSTGLTMATGKIITGNLTGTSSKLLLTTTTSNTTYTLLFTDSGGGGIGSTCYIDNGYNIFYNPSTTKLQAPNISTQSVVSYFNSDFNIKSFGITNKINFYNGSVDGTNQLSLSISSTEIKAGTNVVFKGDLTGTSSKLQLTSTASDSAFSLVFTDTGGGGGSSTCYIDNGSNLYYNPLTNILHSPYLLSQSVTGSINTDLKFYSFSITDGIDFYNGSVEGSLQLSMSITTTEIQARGGAVFKGDLTGIASKSKVVGKNDDVYYNIPFTNTTNIETTTSSADWFLDGFNNIQYNPLLNRLKVDKIQVETLYNPLGDLDFNVGQYGYNMYVTDASSNSVKVLSLSEQYFQTTVTETTEDLYYEMSFMFYDGGDFIATHMVDTLRNIQYNPFLQSFKVPNIEVGSLYNTDDIYFNVGLDGSGNPITRLTITSDNKILAGNSAEFFGYLNGSAKKVDLNDFNGSQICYPVFSKASNVATDNELFVDGNSDPLTYNPSTSTLTSTNFVGTCSKVLVTRNNTDQSCWIPFVSTNTTGSKDLYLDADSGDLSYVPSTGILTTTVSNVYVASNGDNTSYYPTFVSNNNTDGSKALKMTSGANNFQYNPSTFTASIRNIRSESLVAFANTDLRIATATGTNKIDFNNTNNTGRICYMDSTGLTMESDKIITGHLKDIFGTNSYSSNQTLGSANYNRLAIFTSTTSVSFDVILSISPTPPEGSVIYIVFRVVTTGNVNNLVVFNGSISATTRVNKFTGQNGDTIGGKFIYYNEIGWFSLSGSF